MIKLLPMAVIVQMAVDEQDSLARSVGTVEKKMKDATQAHVLSFPMAGKVVYAVQKRLEALKSSTNPDGTPKKPQISLAMSLATFWETITRTNGKPGIKLNNHWLSCAVAYGTYVDSELVTEADYDKNTAQCLELASSISTAAGGDVTHDAIVEAAEELRDRSKDSAKNLRDILAKVKTPKEMTAEKAAALVKQAIAGGHLTTVISEVGAEIAHVEDSEVARNAFFGMITASDMFQANVDKGGKRRFDDDTLNAWAEAYQKANANEKPAGEKAPVESPTETSDTEVTEESAPLAAAA